MSTQAAKRHAAREKRRRLLERVALVALAALLVALVFAGAFLLFILFCTQVWFA